MKGLEAKEGKQLGDPTCRMGQAVQHQSLQRHKSHFFFTFSPFTECVVNCTANYSLFFEPKNALDV